MTKFASIGIAATLALTLGAAAHAQSASPQIPTPANPYPTNPIATDGSPISLDRGDGMSGLQTSRSVFVAPVGAVIDAGTQTAGALLNVVPATADAITGR